MKISANTVGLKGFIMSLRDDHGSGTSAVQVEVPATATVNYDVVGRAAPEAPWVNLKSGQTGGFLEAMAWVPFLGLRINSYSGTGDVNLWAETA